MTPIGIACSERDTPGPVRVDNRAPAAAGWGMTHASFRGCRWLGLTHGSGTSHRPGSTMAVWPAAAVVQAGASGVG